MDPANQTPANDFQPLDPRQITADQIVSLLVAGVVVSGSAVGLTVMGAVRGFDTVWLGLGIAAIGLTVMLIMAAVYWPRWEYRHTSWRLDDAGLEVRRGVLWRHRIAVPFARVQHADVSQGPLQRPFELGTLTIHTAGTENASVTLAGLAHQKAIQLRDELVRQRKAVDVV